MVACGTVIVLFAGSHHDVEVIVQAAVRHNVCIIPIGGRFASFSAWRVVGGVTDPMYY